MLSAAVSFILGLAVNYLLSKLWVFNKENIRNKTAEFSVFALIGVVGLFLNEAIIWLFTAKVGLFYLASKIIAAVITLFWNFFARKFALFK